ncbi:MAG: protein kinase [Verrucomicrobiota bacterium]|nr:protein kinase [Verrucomicrobiota bacterium]
MQIKDREVVSRPKLPGYFIDELIGEGSTGSVWTAAYKGKTRYAVKSLRGIAINRQVLSDSLVKIYKSKPHPGIAKIHDFDLASPHAYITMELYAERTTNSEGTSIVRPRNLETLCGNVSSDDGWKIAIQIAEAMAHLHENRIIHCNLKPTNVLFGSGMNPQPKISDFSQGMLGGTEQLETSDSLFYCAPEQLQHGKQFFEGKGEQWDVYAYGATIYRLMTGKFCRLNDEIVKYRKKRETQLNLHSEISTHRVAMALSSQETVDWPSEAISQKEQLYRSIIEKCLSLNETHRYSDMNEVLEELQECNNNRQITLPSEGNPLNVTINKKTRWEHAKTVLLSAVVSATATVIITLNLQDKKSEIAPVPLPEPTKTPKETPINLNPEAEKEEPTPAPEIKDARIANLINDFQQSQSALNELCRMLASLDEEGNPLYRFPEGTIGSMLTYYDKFISRNADDPALRDSVINALSNSSELHILLGDFTSAGQKLTQATELIESDEIGGGDAGELLQRRARLYKNLSTSKSGAQMHRAATAAATQSFLYYKELLSREPNDPANSRAAAESALLLAKKLRNSEQIDLSQQYADQTIQIITATTADSLPLEKDQLLLASAHFELGQTLHEKGELDIANESYQNSIAGYTELVTAFPEKLNYQFQLARALGEEADIAFVTADPEANVINNDAIEILTALTEKSPSNRYKFQMARRLYAFSRSIESEGESSAARTQSHAALNILKDLIKNEPSNFDYQNEIAQLCRQLADLHKKAGDTEKSVQLSREAVRHIKNLLEKDLDVENNNRKKNNYREMIAKDYGKLGWHLANTGEEEDIPEAKESFKTAQDYYQQILDIEPANDDAKRWLQWAKDCLAELP